MPSTAKRVVSILAAVFAGRSPTCSAIGTTSARAPTTTSPSATSPRWRPILIRADIIVISVVFSILVGVVFGLYPAQKAAKLDPIEALRSE